MLCFSKKLEMLIKKYLKTLTYHQYNRERRKERYKDERGRKEREKGNCKKRKIKNEERQNRLMVSWQQTISQEI